MGYHKRRYRRVTTNGRVIDRAWWSGTKVTMFADGRWYVNAVGTSEGFERPRFIALDGKQKKQHFTEFEKKYGKVTVRSYPSMCPLDYGPKSGRPYERRKFEDRFKPVAGGLNVPS
ncbi:hypothetical protein SEA_PAULODIABOLI_54 [Microbacterium phage PauloDiaboli]|nr:hypothetical protein SEA_PAULODIABOLI_54 [Microbacterium phage PauloDiaboli]